ncbi:MAG: MFS transporter [Cyclobacteriaceae bacterium]
MNNNPTKPTRKRFGILVLIFITVVINYMDRSNISVAAFAISEELELSTIQMGWIFSAFATTYAILQIPGGALADIFKPRLFYSVILTCWSVVTLLQGFANSLATLIGYRASIGVFEAPSYPTNNKIVTSWFPESERASAIAIYTSGQYIGLAFLTPVLVTIQSYMGWRGLFIVSGIIGIVWAGIWYVFYRDPESHKSVNDAELEYIREGGGVSQNTDPDKVVNKFEWSNLVKAFSYKKLWGIYLGQFCIGTMLVFFLTWFPTYLVKFRGLDFIKSGFLASIPFLAAFVGILLSGFASDYMVKKGYSNEIARKAPILIGLLLSVSVVGANYTDSTFLIIMFLAIAFFGNGFASINWVFVSIMAPKNLLGLVGGVFNAIGSIAAVLTPIVIGYLVEDGDFRPALIYVSVVAVIGFFSYVFLVGKVERLGTEEESEVQVS